MGKAQDMLDDARYLLDGEWVYTKHVQEIFEAMRQSFPKPKPLYDMWNPNEPSDFDYDKTEINAWVREWLT